MFRKILCAVLVLCTLLSFSLAGVSAAEAELASVSADNLLYFEVPSDWKNFKTVYCHIWEYGGTAPLAPFQSKKEKCDLVEGNLYSYDVSKVGGLEAGKYYGVVFSLDTLIQTYDTIMTNDCLGDTLYCNNTYYEHPLDSNRTCRAGFFRNQDSSKYGPLMQITSIGNLIGTCLPPGETAEGLFNRFLKDTLDNARQYSGKSDQELIDDMAEGLGLSQDSIEKLIKDSGISVAWAKAESDAPKEDKPINPGATATGQKTTVVTAAVVMMVISVGFVLFFRKKSAVK
ncbi:MAG: hypothetical protein ACI4GZ_01720 [Ruminococcus sp.]